LIEAGKRCLAIYHIEISIVVYILQLVAHQYAATRLGEIVPTMDKNIGTVRHILNMEMVAILVAEALNDFINACGNAAHILVIVEPGQLQRFAAK